MSEALSPAHIVLITGGAGFLGQALLRELCKTDDVLPPPAEIRIFDTKPLKPEFMDMNSANITSIVGDIRSYDQVSKACEGVDAVIHAASLVDWGSAGEQLLDEVNINGTHNVIRACREAGVRALVYTSTMDVVCSGRPVRDGDETLPYPNRFNDEYARSKASAEQIALSSNGAPLQHPGAEGGDALRTCAVRPCGMFGEADPYHVSSTLRMAMEGKLSFRVGNGKAVFQHVYVGNVAHGHRLALRSLLQADGAADGQVYLITDAPAANFFDFLAPVIEGLGYTMPPKNRSIPYPIAFSLGACAELLARLCRPFFSFTPTLTRSSVRILCKDFSFTSDKAARHLGYRPIYSEEESIARTVAWFAEHGPVS